MTVVEALETAKGNPSWVARPTSWTGTARGLTYAPAAAAWLDRDFTAARDAVDAAAPVRAGEPWEVVDSSVLHREAIVLGRKRAKQGPGALPGQSRPG